jgi:hypothetical protein
MQLLYRGGNPLCADCLRIWPPGKRLMVNHRWPSNIEFLCLAGESERQITPDTTANFSTFVT